MVANCLVQIQQRGQPTPQASSSATKPPHRRHPLYDASAFLYGVAPLRTLPRAKLRSAPLPEILSARPVDVLPSWTHCPAKRRRANKTLIVASMALRLRECFAPLDIGHEHCNQQASAHAMAQVIHITLSVFSLFCSLAYRPHDPEARFPATGSLLR